MPNANVRPLYYFHRFRLRSHIVIHSTMEYLDTVYPSPGIVGARGRLQVAVFDQVLHLDLFQLPSFGQRQEVKETSPGALPCPLNLKF